MRAIRGVRSDAVLVQTDDLGKTFSTPALRYQAEFENERRWLTFDLLCGRVGQEHPLWGWLRSSGLEERELAWFSQNPCPPDVVGINHYLSSERFLDEDLDRYPKDAHGGNGRDRYADVLAARVLADGPTGPKGVLREAWLRYGLPLAVTEAHNGCTRDEQLRWLAEVWDAAASLRGEGIGVRAVTAWSLLGAFGWDELACASGGRYEPGVFDVRSPKPRPTALAAMLRALAARSGYDHPVLDTRGWWRTPERIRYGDPSRSGPPDRRTRALPRHLVIVGARGTLGRVFARVCRARNLPHHLVARDELDIASEASVERALDALRPWAVVNAAGYVRVDDAESDEPRCFRENADGASTLAAGCSRRDVALVTFSSDLVFDGNKGCRYLEDDAVAPLSVYGRSKAEGERRVLETYPKALVVRTSAFFGPWDEHNFVTVTLAALERGEAVAAAADWVVTPTYVPALVDATLDLLIDGESGLWHLANQDAVTWAGLAERAAAASGVVRGRIEPRATADLDLAAPRPRDSALGSRRASLLGPLDEVLERYVGDRERSSRQVPGLAVQQR
jgi:dTDP-4-dehydrorhamnose reductase